jgi:hypothetical protein
MDPDAFRQMATVELDEALVRFWARVGDHPDVNEHFAVAPAHWLCERITSYLAPDPDAPVDPEYDPTLPGAGRTRPRRPRTAAGRGDRRVKRSRPLPPLRKLCCAGRCARQPDPCSAHRRRNSSSATWFPEGSGPVQRLARTGANPANMRVNVSLGRQSCRPGTPNADPTAGEHGASNGCLRPSPPANRRREVHAELVRHRRSSHPRALGSAASRNLLWPHLRMTLPGARSLTTRPDADSCHGVRGEPGGRSLCALRPPSGRCLREPLKSASWFRFAQEDGW